ncbi:MAG: HlyD family secretion protein [Silvibacterium sp.]|nr:HlyD family secretion protein [Silvibacterium sp.]
MATIVERETIENARSLPGELLKSRLVQVALGISLLGLLASGYVLWRYFSSHESTDDAQIDGHVVAVSARIPGQVAEVMIQDQQIVKAGEVLLRIDSRDYEVAAAKAEADLAGAEATVRAAETDVPITATNASSTLTTATSSRVDAEAGVNAANHQLSIAQARLEAARAQAKAAEADYQKIDDDAARYSFLILRKEISEQQYDHIVQSAESAKATSDARSAEVTAAQENVRVAQSAIQQARARVTQAGAQIQAASTGGQQISLSQSRADLAHANLLERRALLNQAKLNLSYTTICAPVGGVVGKKTVEVGQNVSSGQQLMAIVPVDEIWVTANFKETQLKRMRPGQRATIAVDAYGRELTGRLTAIGGASGARFSLLPPENATGNYVKVVQRIPIRIDLDSGQDLDHRLRPGMSVRAKVYLR